ncbi:MAG: gamma-glutamyl-gamma-aminobutyrate hydrolase family protein [Betaproteobacteria bacterium]|nr:MAG: gamma-glutamyl-gamma-aminobutyrate hydrolase family protein [Betaproteobacteria bacterium]
MKQKPVVLVPACNRMIGQHPFHIVGRKYIDAIRLADCVPLVVPSIADDEIDVMLDLADGVLLTGSPSNVHPSRFGEAVRDTELPLDVERDNWTLPLIPRVLQRGVPLFAICRGFQETNVALGGSLHQAVHEVPQHRDHRGANDAPVEVRYGFAHTVNVEPGGTLEQIIGASPVEVNSVHGQGVGRLADVMHDSKAQQFQSVYYLQGFSGHGLALTGLAGKLVAEAIDGNASRFDTFARIRHRPFPGGRLLRTPALVAGMAYYRLKDLL